MDLLKSVEILETVQKLIDPHAVIAGGAVRDYLFDREIKDIDIWLFTEMGLHDLEVYLQDIFPLLNTKIVLHPIAGESASTWTKGIVKMEGLEYDVDFIIFHEPIMPGGINVLMTFDFGICQAAFDGQKIHTTALFNEDKLNLRMTFNPQARAREDLDRVVNDHLPRLRAKYPHFEVIGVPDKNDWPKNQTKDAGFKVLGY